jgi:hypothetical protein
LKNMSATHYVASTEIGTVPCWPTRASSYTGTMVQRPDAGNPLGRFVAVAHGRS